jgi:hypothetical protein
LNRTFRRYSSRTFRPTTPPSGSNSRVGVRNAVSSTVEAVARSRLAPAGRLAISAQALQFDASRRGALRSSQCAVPHARCRRGGRTRLNPSIFGPTAPKLQTAVALASILLFNEATTEHPSEKDSTMVVAVRTKRELLADRTQAVCGTWTQAERLLRVIAGSRLRRVFAGRFAPETPQPMIWAVASLSIEDLSRLAQNG